MKQRKKSPKLKKETTYNTANFHNNPPQIDESRVTVNNDTHIVNTNDKIHDMITAIPGSPSVKTNSVDAEIVVDDEEDNIEEDELDDIELEAPPAPTSHVVAVAFNPTRKDEIALEAGDLIGIEKEYGDGWARGQNISRGRKRCVFPLIVLTPITSGPSQAVGNKTKEFKIQRNSFVKATDVKIPQRTSLSLKRNSRIASKVYSNEFGLSAKPEISEDFDEDGNKITIRTDYTKLDGNLVKTITTLYRSEFNVIEKCTKVSFDDNGNELNRIEYDGFEANTFAKILTQYQ